MRSLSLLTALALVSVQLASSAPPNWDVEDKRDIVWVTDIATQTNYVFTTDIVTKTRNAPHLMKGNNPWAQHPQAHQQQPGQVDHNPNKPGIKGKPVGQDANPKKPGVQKGPPANRGNGKPGRPGQPGKPGVQHGPPAMSGNGRPGQPGKPGNNNGDKNKPNPQPKPGAQPNKNRKQRVKAGTGNGGSPKGGNYQAEVLRCHNAHRANHSAPALKWSPSLAATAQKIASSCTFAHNTGVDGGGYGQNLAAGVDPANIAKVISNMFYNNELAAFGDQYGAANPSGFEKWGHFSQVVWKKTSEVGCHTCDCSKKGGLTNVGGGVPPYFTVCNYKAPGNVGGQYAQNVGRPLGRPTIG